MCISKYPELQQELMNTFDMTETDAAVELMLLERKYNANEEEDCCD